MPNFSGIWSPTQQFQARAQNIWPAAPGAPTIGTATAGTNNNASVAFTAPACTGRFPAGITNYTAISTPGCITATGASSPVTVTGLTTGTSYTFRVRANGANGLSGPLSAASNSITATIKTCETFTTAGSYTWVAPAGVTSVAAIAVGGGGRGAAAYCIGCSFSAGAGGGGGGLAYRNAHSVTPGTSYSLVVGAAGGVSWFVNQSTVLGVNGGGEGFDNTPGQGGSVISGSGMSGTNGRGGVGSVKAGSGGGGGGGGAGGYSGEGGAGNSGAPAGGGGGGGRSGDVNAAVAGGGGGGAVGIFGAGASGAAPPATQGSGGFGGSGGANGSSAGGLSGAAGASPGGGGGGPGTTFGGGSAGGRGAGSPGAVRIVWCTAGVRGTPSFPSTNVGA